ncbi:unnamed protein product [Trichobilharzia szidati]|nr:unnamed protein product [Trichobilharzia szidati]
MMLPFTFFIQWSSKRAGRFCWVLPRDQFFHIYHTLFSNFGPVQTLILLLLNVTFLMITKRYLQQSRFHPRGGNHLVNRKEIRICLLVLILSTFYIAISIPQAICFLLVRTSSAKLSKLKKMLAYDIAHFMWSLNAIREIADFIVYAVYFKPLTDLLFNWLLNIRALSRLALRFMKSGSPNRIQEE